MSEQLTPDETALKIYNDSIKVNCLKCTDNCPVKIIFRDGIPYIPHCYEGDSGKIRFKNLTRIIARENIEFLSSFHKGENDSVFIATNNLCIKLIEARKK